ncbi:hypothetical protein D3C75_891570 [compost metagenome]
MTISSHYKIEQHLIQQKARAVQTGALPSDRCQYRTDTGLMCAAGCLIPDEKYVPEMEGLTVSGLQNHFPGCLPTDISDRDMQAWQSYHDHYTYLDGITYSYKQWLNGDEEQHPTKFKVAVIANSCTDAV